MVTKPPSTCRPHGHLACTLDGMAQADERGDVPRFGLPDRIRKTREHADLTQTQAGPALGITRQALNGYEAGRVTPAIPFLRALAALAHVSDHWLITGDDGPCPNELAAGACGCKIDSLEPRDLERHRRRSPRTILTGP